MGRPPWFVAGKRGPTKLDYMWKLTAPDSTPKGPVPTGMRVLHLPVNIASQISITVRALRDIGIDAEGLAIGSNRFQEDRDIEVIRIYSRNELFRWLISKFHLTPSVLRRIFSADIVHWHFASFACYKALDLIWARILGRPGVVEFWGSDIRVPEVLSAENPYFADAYAGDRYEYKESESRKQSYGRQELFSRNGVKTCFVPEMGQKYLKPGLFSSVYRNRVRLIMNDYQPKYPGDFFPRTHYCSCPHRKDR